MGGLRSPCETALQLVGLAAFRTALTTGGGLLSRGVWIVPKRPEHDGDARGGLRQFWQGVLPSALTTTPHDE